MSEEHNVAADPAQPAAAPEVVADAPAAPPAQPETPIVTEAPATEPVAPETPAEAEAAPAEPTEAPAAPEQMLKAGEPEEGEKKPGDEAKPAEIPQVSEEIVEYKFNLPEGVELQAEPLQEFTTFAKEQKFSPETAQKLVDFHVKAVDEVEKAVTQRQLDVFREWTSKWQAEAMADPELGGAGFQTSLAQANWALTHFMPAGEWRDRLNRDLASTGMAYSPALFRLFFNFAKFASEPSRAVAATNLPNPQTMPGASGAPRGGGRLSYKHPRGGQRGGSAA